MQSTEFSPCAELRELLLPAYAPCTHFGGACKGVAKWDTGKGYAPRGFVGALGSLDEVELVLVAAEPGDPLPGETHEGPSPPTSWTTAPRRPIGPSTGWILSSTATSAGF